MGWFVTQQQLTDTRAYGVPSSEISKSETNSCDKCTEEGVHGIVCNGKIGSGQIGWELGAGGEAGDDYEKKARKGNPGREALGQHFMAPRREGGRMALGGAVEGRSQERCGGGEGGGPCRLKGQAEGRLPRALWAH